MNISANSVIVEDDFEDVARSKKAKQNQELVKLNASSKKSFVKNVKHNSNKNLLNVLAFGIAGAVMYPLVPTLVQAVSEKDMSGAKGLIMGVGSATLLGLGIGKPEMAVGAISAMGTHLLYAKGTKIIEELTNTQIFRMNPDSVVYQNN